MTTAGPSTGTPPPASAATTDSAISIHSRIASPNRSTGPNVSGATREQHDRLAPRYGRIRPITPAADDPREPARPGRRPSGNESGCQRRTGPILRAIASSADRARGSFGEPSRGRRSSRSSCRLVGRRPIGHRAAVHEDVVADPRLGPSRRPLGRGQRGPRRAFQGRRRRHGIVRSRLRRHAANPHPRHEVTGGGSDRSSVVGTGPRTA
jgi:hypothetical protein